MPLWLSSLISAAVVPIAFSLIRGDILSMDALTIMRVLGFWAIFVFSAQLCVGEGSSKSSPFWPSALLTLFSAKGGEHLDSDMELVGRITTFFIFYYALMLFVFSSMKSPPPARVNGESQQ